MQSKTTESITTRILSKAMGSWSDDALRVDSEFVIWRKEKVEVGSAVQRRTIDLGSGTIRRLYSLSRCTPTRHHANIDPRVTRTAARLGYGGWRDQYCSNLGSIDEMLEHKGPLQALLDVNASAQSVSRTSSIQKKYVLDHDRQAGQMPSSTASLIH